MRAIIHLLSLELFGASLALADFPTRPDLCGLGLSDWHRYAVPLARRLKYTNTFFHKAPRLDISNIPAALEGTLDFLIATDVFEHVAPPIAAAFANARRLLKPTGVLVFSVPYLPGVDTREHFPELHAYALERRLGQQILRNVTRDGREQYFDQLVFHDGPGATLEMRVFGEAGLRACLTQAGFRRVRFYGEPFLAHGVHWLDAWSWPLTARPA